MATKKTKAGWVWSAAAAILIACGHAQHPQPSCPDATLDEYAVYSAILAYALKGSAVDVDPMADLRPVIGKEVQNGSPAGLPWRRPEDVWHLEPTERVCLRHLPPKKKGPPDALMRRVFLSRVTFDAEKRTAHLSVSYECEGAYAFGTGDYEVAWLGGRWTLAGQSESGHCYPSPRASDVDEAQSLMNLSSRDKQALCAGLAEQARQNNKDPILCSDASTGRLRARESVSGCLDRLEGYARCAALVGQFELCFYEEGNDACYGYPTPTCRFLRAACGLSASDGGGE